jgi:hypothetical protein
MIKRLLFILLFIFINVLGYSITYYVSPNGNDNNNGTSISSPWRTINKVQQISSQLQPGDKILFQRGGIYEGKLVINSSGTSNNPIIIEAYGNGPNPIIKGSINPTNWTVHNNNIWKANVTQTVRHVWVNDELMTLARFPNQGWLSTTSTSSTQITSNQLGQPSGYWNGAEIVLRNTYFSFENRIVSSNTTNSISFPALAYAFGGNWGFRLQNKLSELDAPGEWFWQNGVLYFWAPNNANPNSLNISVSVQNDGIEIANQRSRITIRNISFKHQHGAGVHNTFTNNIVVDSCQFNFIGSLVRGVSTNCIFSNNIVTNTFRSGLQINGGGNQIKNNILENIALFAGFGESQFGYFGMYVLGNNNLVSGNRLKRTGNSAIFYECLGGGTIIEKNFIDSAVALINDGGGIYFDRSVNCIVRDNIVINGDGGLEGSIGQFPGYGSVGDIKVSHGIFFGNAIVSGTIVERNTIANCNGYGIIVDHTSTSSNNIIRNNTMFNNRHQLAIDDLSVYSSGFLQFNGLYQNNIMYSLREDQYCMMQFMQNNNPQPVQFGTFNDNFYYNPYSEINILYWTYGNYSLERWRNITGQDLNSQRHPERWVPYEVTQEVTSNMISNGTFNSNINGWSGWPSQGQISRDLTLLDNGALRVFFTNGSTSPNYYLRHSPTSISLQNGSYYQLKFSSQSLPSVFGNVTIEARGQSQAGTPNFMESKTFPFDSERRENNFIFRSNRNEPAQMFWVSRFGDSPYWIDNVELKQVQVQPIDPNEDNILVFNDSDSTQSFNLPLGVWKIVGGGLISNSIQIEGYQSKVLYRVEQVESARTKIKFILSGPYNGQLMHDSLRSKNLIPLQDPYIPLGYVYTNHNINTSISSNMLENKGDSSVVDWVIVEIRNSQNPSIIEYSKPLLILRNGTLIDIDNSSTINFPIPMQPYYVSINHRNHLGMMTGTSRMLNGQEIIDFTVDSLFGTNPSLQINQKSTAWAGDINSDGNVKYTGNNNDRDLILTKIGGTIPTNTIYGYNSEDVNMDGFVKYTGNNNDRDVILFNIGGTQITNVRNQQIP